VGFSPFESDDEIAKTMEWHDATAAKLLAMQDPRGDPFSFRGPEGIDYVFGPRFTRDLISQSLRDLYDAPTTERILAGQYRQAGGVVLQAQALSLAAGWSFDDALEYLKDQSSYVGKKALAGALQKREDERQEDIRRYVPPILIPIQERIAAARAKAALTGWCRIFAACPTW
jgi:hypothetical protein